MKIDRREFIKSIVVGTIGFALSNLEDAIAISPIKKVTICYAHCDLVVRIMEQKIDLSKRSNQGHIEIPRMIEGGVGVQVFACPADKLAKSNTGCTEMAKRMITVLDQQFKRHSNAIELALNLDDIKMRDTYLFCNGVCSLSFADTSN